MLEQWTIFVTHRLRFVKKFTRPDFQAKDFTPLISTALVIKTQKMSVFEEIYITGKKFYTAGGSDGSDKSHLCHPLHLTFQQIDSRPLDQIFV